MKIAHPIAGAMLLMCSVLQGTATAQRVLTLTGDPWPPYVSGSLGEDADGGIGVVIIREIFQRIDGLEVRFPLQPWKRALRDVEMGRRDGIALLLKTPEREAYMEFSDPVIASRSLVWFRADRFPSGFEWHHTRELLRHHIGVIRGYSYGKDMDRAIARDSAKVTRVASVEQLFAMLARDRLDLALANDAVGMTMAKAYAGTARIVAADHATGEDVYHIGFSRRSGASAWIPRVNQAIRELRRDGAIERMLKDYYNQD